MIDERDVATILCPDLDRPLDEIPGLVGEAVAPLECRSASHAGDAHDDGPHPTTIGPYTVCRVIGRGGQATVFEATDRKGHRVAIKLFHLGRSGKPNTARFRREARTLGRLRHPGVARLITSGTTAGGQPYLVMELIAGATLRQHARRLDLAARLTLFRGICQAVAAAHDRGIIHRDLKPSNILIDRDGKPRVCDFGLARFIERDPNHTQLSEGGRLIGTPRYMSPEQISGNKLDVRSDVYSLGLILYQLVTDSLPYTFSNSSLYHQAQVVCQHTPERPRQLDPEVDPRLDAIVMKAIEKDPAKRHPSVKALIRELARLTPRPERRTPLAQRLVATVRLVCAGILLGMAFGAVYGVVGLQQRAVTTAREEAADARRARIVARQYSAQVDRVLDRVVQEIPEGRPDALTNAAAIHTALAFNCRALGLGVRARQHLDEARQLADQAARQLLDDAERAAIPPQPCPQNANPPAEIDVVVPQKCDMK